MNSLDFRFAQSLNYLSVNVNAFFLTFFLMLICVNRLEFKSSYTVFTFDCSVYKLYIFIIIIKILKYSIIITNVKTE